VLWVFALVCCSKEKIAKLAELINKTNVQEMRWIIMIILKGEPAMTILSVLLMCQLAATTEMLGEDPSRIEAGNQ
jgi:hypothetical protein